MERRGHETKIEATVGRKTHAPPSLVREEGGRKVGERKKKFPGPRQVIENVRSKTQLFIAPDASPHVTDEC